MGMVLLQILCGSSEVVDKTTVRYLFDELLNLLNQISPNAVSQQRLSFFPEGMN